MTTQHTDPIFNVSDRVIVITGACGLIGRTMSKALYERGAKLILADIEEAKPAEYAASLGENAKGIASNVRFAEEVKKLLDFTLEQFGRADVLICNHQFKPKGFLEAKAETFPEELWDDINDVNYKGTFLLCRDFGNQMLKQGKGSIINFASTYGVVSSNPALYADNSMGNPIAYTASKGGVITLTKYLGSYWASKGVRVNAITPHGVWNNHEDAFVKRFSAMSPSNRLMQPEEILGGILFLASDASSYVTGSNLLVEGGWTAW
jgi:NAD(P)-dependent dehydrogenase (short-subunit alcohol dehydrogenase family)